MITKKTHLHPPGNTTDPFSIRWSSIPPGWPEASKLAWSPCPPRWTGRPENRCRPLNDHWMTIDSSIFWYPQLRQIKNWAWKTSKGKNTIKKNIYLKQFCLLSSWSSQEFSLSASERLKDPLRAMVDHSSQAFQMRTWRHGRIAEAPGHLSVQFTQAPYISGIFVSNGSQKLSKTWRLAIILPLRFQGTRIHRPTRPRDWCDSHRHRGSILQISMGSVPPVAGDFV